MVSVKWACIAPQPACHYTILWWGQCILFICLRCKTRSFWILSHTSSLSCRNQKTPKLHCLHVTLQYCSPRSHEGWQMPSGICLTLFCGSVCATSMHLFKAIFYLQGYFMAWWNVLGNFAQQFVWWCLFKHAGSPLHPCEMERHHKPLQNYNWISCWPTTDDMTLQVSHKENCEL